MTWHVGPWVVATAQEVVTVVSAGHRGPTPGSRAPHHPPGSPGSPVEQSRQGGGTGGGLPGC